MQGSPVEPDPIEAAVSFLRERLPRAPRVILILGSGLGGAVSEIADPVRIPYAEIPGFPSSTVAGHQGTLVTGIWSGVEVAAMQGRFHLYEGWPADTVAFPLRVLRALGAERLVVTNAAGAIDPGLAPGSLMVIADHINMMFRNPLIGRVRPGEERFPDMSDPYDSGMRREAVRTALDAGIPFATGVYAGVLGPSYETPAEIRMLRRMGADAVGMSTVPEVIAARALGLTVLGISCITNMAAGLGGGRLSHDEVLEEGTRGGRLLVSLVTSLLPRVTV